MRVTRSRSNDDGIETNARTAGARAGRARYPRPVTTHTGRPPPSRPSGGTSPRRRSRAVGSQPARDRAVQAGVRPDGRRARHRLARAGAVRAGGAPGARERLGRRPVRSATGHGAVPVRTRDLCACALVVYSVMDVGRIWPLFAIAFAFGAADAMLSPARRAIPPLITTPRGLPADHRAVDGDVHGCGDRRPGARRLPLLGGAGGGLRRRRGVGAGGDRADPGHRLRPRARAAHRTARRSRRRSRASTSCVARRSCSPRSRSTCSPCCSAGPSR